MIARSTGLGGGLPRERFSPRAHTGCTDFSEGNLQIGAVQVNSWRLTLTPAIGHLNHDNYCQLTASGFVLRHDQ
jgi:hypothetical protein